MDSPARQLPDGRWLPASTFPEGLVETGRKATSLQCLSPLWARLHKNNRTSPAKDTHGPGAGQGVAAAPTPHRAPGTSGCPSTPRRVQRKRYHEIERRGPWTSTGVMQPAEPHPQTPSGPQGHPHPQSPPPADGLFLPRPLRGALMRTGPSPGPSPHKLAACYRTDGETHSALGFGAAPRVRGR